MMFSINSPPSIVICILLSINQANALSLQSPEPIRINKVLKKTHSRRQADQLIADGRLSVNNEPVHSAGQRVIPYQDVIRLDGRIVKGWEEMNYLNEIKDTTNHNNKAPPVFQYIKYWKPIGITCTTDKRIKDNLIDALHHDGCHPTTRIFPVGRLDKETSGLILLTSDGRLPNASLRRKHKHPKTYMVKLNKPVSQSDIQRLRDGVTITTIAQRDGNRSKPLTAPTLPCQVRPISHRILEITLVEGRNRQIRKMMEVCGYRVMGLHRVEFMGITLEGLGGEGDWSYLDGDEMRIVERVLDGAERDEGELKVDGW